MAIVMCGLQMDCGTSCARVISGLYSSSCVWVTVDCGSCHLSVTGELCGSSRVLVTGELCGSSRVRVMGGLEVALYGLLVDCGSTNVRGYW